MEQVNIDYTFTAESRSFCPDCEFLKSRCLCDTLKLIPNNVHIIILQHPTETKHPLNTVRIMKKSFKKISVIVGEDFTADLKLNTILCDTNNHCALLYPDEKAVVLDSQQSSSTTAITHIILIDGTWRKAKKIFMLSKNLHSVQTLKLEPKEQSDYRIRKAPSEDSLSTLEASVLALNILEPTLNTEAVTKSFKKMIDYQIEKMGRVLYQANYLNKKKSE